MEKLRNWRPSRTPTPTSTRQSALRKDSEERCKTTDAEASREKARKALSVRLMGKIGKLPCLGGSRRQREEALR